MLVAWLFCRRLESPTDLREGSAKIYVEIVPGAFSAKSVFFYISTSCLQTPG